LLHSFGGGYGISIESSRLALRTQSNLLLTYSGVHSCLGIWCAVVSAFVHVHVPNLRSGIYPPQLAILFSEVFPEEEPLSGFTGTASAASAL